MADERAISQDEADRIKRLRGFGLTYREVAERIGRSPRVVAKVEKRGFTASDKGAGKRKPRPGDFAVMIEKMPYWDAARHYGVDFPLIKRWAREIGFTRTFGDMQRGRRSGRHKAIPEDFEAIYRSLGFTGARDHYRIAQGTMCRWLRESGVQPLRPRKPAASAVKAAPMQPPPGYEQFKRRLGPVPTIYSVAA